MQPKVQAVNKPEKFGATGQQTVKLVKLVKFSHRQSKRPTKSSHGQSTSQQSMHTDFGLSTSQLMPSDVKLT